jgi:hypothetical protein
MHVLPARTWRKTGTGYRICSGGYLLLKNVGNLSTGRQDFHTDCFSSALPIMWSRMKTYFLIFRYRQPISSDIYLEIETSYLYFINIALFTNGNFPDWQSNNFLVRNSADIRQKTSMIKWLVSHGQRRHKLDHTRLHKSLFLCPKQSWPPKWPV